jgi:hypothetical protein
MQDVLIVSYLVSKEFDLLSRSIFDHSDDCAEDCAGNATADGLTCPSLSRTCRVLYRSVAQITSWTEVQ